MISSFSIKALFNIYKIIEVNQSVNKVKVFGKIEKGYLVLKIDLNEDRSIKAIRSERFTDYSNAENYFINTFKNWD